MAMPCSLAAVAVAVLCVAATALAQVAQDCHPPCPAPNVFLENPRNCSTYYSCNDHLDAILMPCPPGLKFVLEENECDWPAKSHCVDNPDAPCPSTHAPITKPTTAAPTTKPPTTAAPTTKHPTTAATKLPTTAAPTTTHKALNAEENSDACEVKCGEGYYLKANPKDCSTYFSCTGAGPVLMPCYPGLEWNDRTHRCDWPNQAQCEVACSKYQEDKAVLKTAVADDDDDCDVDCGEGFYLKADPSNCSTYYSCHNGIATSMPCYPGLQWNDRTHRCDWPEQAQCEVTCPKDEGTSLEKKHKLEKCDEPVCQQPGVLMANPGKCGTFYSCVGYTPVLMRCPKGLHFMPSQSRCEWKSNARCTKTCRM